jgi:hypothetical protein
VTFFLEPVHRGDDIVVHLPVARLVDVEVFAVDQELTHLELVVQLVLPLFGKPGRCHEQNPSQTVSLLQRSQQHAGLDGLAQAHIVGNQPV